MKQQAVHDYVKKKRGLYAADGGEVPDEEEEAPEEDVPVEDTPDVPAEAAPLPPAAPPQDRQAAIRAHLERQYAQAADRSGVQDAMDTRDNKNAVSRIFEGLEGMARSRGEANGGDGVNHRGYSEQRAENQGDVQQAEAARQSNIQGFLRQNEMDRQVAADAMKSNEDARRSAGAKLTADMNDAGSTYSRARQPAFQHLYKKQLGDTDVSTLSANAMLALGKQYQAKAIADAKAESVHEGILARKQAHDDSTANLAQRKDEATNAKNDATSLHLATDDFKSLRKDLDSDQASSRTNIGVAASKIAGASRVMAFADVSPEEIDAAHKDPKAKAALIAKLDLLPPYKKAEVVQGLMTQISNGGGSLGQFEHLNTPTAEGTIANIEQYFTSHPEAANAGPLLYDNLMSLKAERDTSKGVIDKHVAKLKKSHPFAFSHPGTKAQAEEMYNEWATPPESSQPVAAPAPQGGPGMAIGAPAGPPLDAIEAEMARRKLKPKTQGSSGGF